MSLNNLSVRLGGAGRTDEGFAAIEAAVEIYRRLAASNSAVHEPALATSLNNLGRAGRPNEVVRVHGSQPPSQARSYAR